MLKVTKFEFSLFGINTYIVWDDESRECVIVDPGMISEEEHKAIDQFIDRENLIVRHLINTHLHIDHSIANPYIEKRYGVKATSASEEKPLGENIPQQAAMFGLPGKFEAVSISSFLKEGDKVMLGKETLEVIQVGGHSPGSILLYSPKDYFLIAGDVLFKGSIGRSDLPGGNYRSLVEGIKKKLLSLPAQTIVYPGHGEATTIGYESEFNPFLG